jgi:hypothetical protein
MPDDVEKFLSDKQQLESRRQELIKETLRQKEAAIKAFDGKLARLGYDEDHAQKRSRSQAQQRSEKAGVTLHLPRRQLESCRKLVRRVAQRAIGEVSIVRRRLRQGVPQQLADDMQRLAARHQMGCESVAQVMNTHGRLPDRQKLFPLARRLFRS